MTRLFLSVLGTGDYVEAYYRLGNKKFGPTRFAQCATVFFHCDDWVEKDRIVIFTTEEAYQKNWLDLEQNGALKGLKTCLENLALKPAIESIRIPTGASEEEIWEIFDIMFRAMKEGDEVIFDITHAFRSIPMLAMVILNYARVVKNISIRGIYYGAFETLGPPLKVKEMPVEERVAPIFNLTAFDELLNWSIALDRFIKTGDAGAVSDLSKDISTPILRQKQGQDESARKTRDFAVAIQRFSQVMTACRGRSISESAAELKSIIDESLSAGSTRVTLKPLLENLKRRLDVFTGDMVNDGFEAVRWCFEHNLIQQAYTILRETIITKVSLESGIDWETHDKREAVSSAMRAYYNGISRGSKIQGSDKCDQDVFKQCLPVMEKNEGLVKIFCQSAEYRNDLNHAGLRENPHNIDGFRKKLAEFLSGIDEIKGSLKTE